MPRGPAKDHDDKRQALRDGAARYFARHGFDRASMTGAARECGVSKALLYHYYDSKEALLHDILATHLGALEQAMAAAAPQGLRALLDAILTVYEDADAEHKLQLGALDALPADMRHPLITTQRRLVHILSGAVHVAHPDLPSDRLRAATMTIFGILNWFYMWHRPGKGLSRAAYSEMVADFVQAGLDAL